MPCETVIVIPCFNEEQRLAPEAFTGFMKQHRDVAFLFVDDGSRDGTANVLERICSEEPELASLVTLKRNRGKAEAVRLGLLQACRLGARFVGFWDADLSTPLGEIPRFLPYLRESDYLMVLGSRVKLLGKDIRRRAMRHYVGRVFATCASLVLNIPVYDTQCGAKIFRVAPHLLDVLATPFLSKWIFDVEIIARFQGLLCADKPRDIQYRLYEIPVERWVDVAGSKVRPRDFIEALIELLRIHIKYGRRR